IVWPLALVGGLLMTVLLLGLLFGWPLMFATISTERTDSFDALSRSFAYTFQRPLQYLFYALVAGLIGLLGWLLVILFATGLGQLTAWAASWGSNVENIRAVMSGTASDSTVFSWGSNLVRFFNGLVLMLADAFLISYFWTSATGIYLLLRR